MAGSVVVRQSMTRFPGWFSCLEYTESAAQPEVIRNAFRGSPITVDTLVVPQDYDTPNRTRLKARGLHYVVDQRRGLWNRKPGRTFIVHFDEESVMVPSELRKLIGCLATTRKKSLKAPSTIRWNICVPPRFAARWKPTDPSDATSRGYPN